MRRRHPDAGDLERANSVALDRHPAPESAQLLAIDLSHLALSGTLTQIDGLELASGAQMVALVKPTFELRSARLAASDADLKVAVSLVREALAGEGWRLLGQCHSPVSGARGAGEAFVHGVEP